MLLLGKFWEIILENYLKKFISFLHLLALSWELSREIELFCLHDRAHTRRLKCFHRGGEAQKFSSLFPRFSFFPARFRRRRQLVRNDFSRSATILPERFRIPSILYDFPKRPWRRARCGDAVEISRRSLNWNSTPSWHLPIRLARNSPLWRRSLITLRITRSRAEPPRETVSALPVRCTRTQSETRECKSLFPTESTLPFISPWRHYFRSSWFVWWQNVKYTDIIVLLFRALRYIYLIWIYSVAFGVSLKFA